MNETILATVFAILGFFGKSLWDTFFTRRKEIDYAQAVKTKATLEETFNKYSKPILLSAADLQDRLWHLTGKQAKSSNPILLDEEFDKPKYATWTMTKRHYLLSTVYLFARYFAWIEILKMKVQFIDSGDNEYTRNFSQKLKNIERTLAETELQKKSTVKITSDRQIFQFLQSYIGEKLIVNENGELTCLGFAEFYDKFDALYMSAEGFTEVVDLLTRAVSKKKNDFCLARCCLLTNALVDLIVFLDPDADYVSVTERETVPVPFWSSSKIKT